MDTMFVKPVEGRRCKDPETFQLVPETGRNVPLTGYWMKRLRKGDIVAADKKVTAAAQPEVTYVKKKKYTKTEGDI